MLSRLVTLAAWLVLAAIVLVTLSPIGLRPETGHVRVERFAAYALLGTLFVAAYPRHFTRVMLLIFAAAVSLEILQMLTPDRHGQLVDAMEKIGGGVAGCSFTRLAQITARRVFR